MQLIKTVQKLKDGSKIAKQIKRIEAIRAEIDRISELLRYVKNQVDTQLESEKNELIGAKIKLVAAFARALKWKWDEEELNYIHRRICELSIGLEEHPDFHTISKQRQNSIDYVVKVMESMSAEDLDIVNSEFLKEKGMDFDTMKNDLRDPNLIRKRFEEMQAKERMEEQKQQHISTKSGAHFSNIEEVNNFVKTIYKKLCKFFHPDKVIDPIQKEAHQEKLQMVNNWYQNGEIDRLLELFISDLKDESKYLLESQQAAILKRSIQELHNNLNATLEEIKQFMLEEDITITSKLEVPGLLKQMKKDMQMEVAEINSNISELQTKKRANNLISDMIWEETQEDFMMNAFIEDEDYDDDDDDDNLYNLFYDYVEDQEDTCMCKECVKRRKLQGKQ